MKGIIQFSMNKASAMLIMIAILFGAGLYSAGSLKLENMPDVSFPLVVVSTAYSASPEDVMSQVSKPIEDKIANVEGIETLSSTSSDTGSQVMVKFTQGVDIDKKKQDLESLIQGVPLPMEASRPIVSTFGFASIPAYYLAVHADQGMSQSDLDNLYKSELKPGFASIKGVDHIDTIGARSTSLDIELKANALNAYGLAPADVTAAIQASLASGTVGTIKLEGNTQMVRVTGELDSIYNLSRLELVSSQGQTLMLKDLAEIKAVTESEFISRVDGKPAIGINLYKTQPANAVEFSDETNSLLEQWEAAHPGITFKKVYDSADEVRDSISGLLREGIIGVGLASLIILLFLRNLRMTAIVLVSIPLSILITFMMMHYLGLTLNVMSLGGIFISVGRIVDDSIVVIENIYSNLQKAKERNQSVLLLAVSQVSMAITSSTLVTVGVFLPIAFVSGVIGEFFRPFALTVACALMASLLVALTVIPLMAKLMVLRGVHLGSHSEEETGKTAAYYEKVLTWCLNHRFMTLLFSAIVFVATLFITIPNLAVNNLSDSEAGRQLSFTIKLPYNTSIESADAHSKQIETMLKQAKDDKGKPLYNFTESLVGYGGTDKQLPYMVQINTELNEDAQPKTVKEQYKTLILAELPRGTEVTTDSLDGGGGFSTTDFSYVLSGDNQKMLEQAAAQVKDKIKDFPELKNVKDTLGDAKTQVVATVSQTKAKRFGLSTSAIQNTVRTWIEQTELGSIRFDNILYTVEVQLSSADKDSIEQLGKIPLRSSSGDIVYLNEVAKIEKVAAPIALQREKQKQVVSITAAIDSPDKAAVSSKVAAALSSIELPEGVASSTGGVTDEIAKNFSQLFVSMGAAIAIVYLIMVLCFGNASTPFAILFSLPLAVIGGLLGLLISNEAINITSLIGFMMLIGIVVTNAIVLLDRAQQLTKDGYSVRSALLEAGRVRLRPIIMTAAATIVAMIPLALGMSHGTLISKGLAVVVIGGLTTSTILTLVVVPVIYELLDSIRKRLSRKSSFGKGHESGEEKSLDM
ncbi:efflux RND transporter permease subunit [Paenibacillus sp. YPG26]|uniref:efflux RND transporter permease subunit n=1 Tax=Paenibacillus sp. YPG26 TaxID=2878915 RepID=UPI00203F4004|nr:efflux RND transporter permease subunit [Paenibacillus sp. YPG26]USB32285.1 efflux RND transporter permease subunit [Paenibacillus sp. YPG26]